MIFFISLLCSYGSYGLMVIVGVHCITYNWIFFPCFWSTFICSVSLVCIIVFKIVVVPIAFSELAVASLYQKLITMLKVLVSFSTICKMMELVLYRCSKITVIELP